MTAPLQSLDELTTALLEIVKDPPPPQLTLPSFAIVTIPKARIGRVGNRLAAYPAFHPVRHLLDLLDRNRALLAGFLYPQK